MVSIDDIKADIGQFIHRTGGPCPLGARRLGFGCFGAAYLLPDGRVLKVAHELDGTARWICDAAIAMRETGKPMEWAPEVYAFWLQEHDGRQMWCAVMEAVEVAFQSHWYVEQSECPADMIADVQAWAEWHGFAEPQNNDIHSGNWGRTSSGRYVVFDPYGDDAGKPTEPLVDVIPEYALYSQQTTANAASAGI